MGPGVRAIISTPLRYGNCAEHTEDTMGTDKGELVEQEGGIHAPKIRPVVPWPDPPPAPSVTIDENAPADVSPSEAIAGFMGWLTCRKQASGPFSSVHQAVSALDLVTEFCESQRFSKPRDGYVLQLKEYPDNLSPDVIISRAPETGPRPSQAVNTKTPENRAPWPDPTADMLQTPEFKAVWQAMKGWDICVPAVDGPDSYSGTTGNHVRAVLDALDNANPDMVSRSAGYRAEEHRRLTRHLTVDWSEEIKQGESATDLTIRLLNELDTRRTADPTKAARAVVTLAALRQIGDHLAEQARALLDYTLGTMQPPQVKQLESLAQIASDFILRLDRVETSTPINPAAIRCRCGALLVGNELKSLTKPAAETCSCGRKWNYQHAAEGLLVSFATDGTGWGFYGDLGVDCPESGCLLASLHEGRCQLDGEPG